MILIDLVELGARLLAVYFLLFFLGMLNAVYITATTDVPMNSGAGKVFYFVLVPFLVVLLCTWLMVLEAAAKILVGVKNLLATWLSLETKQKMKRLFLIIFCQVGVSTKDQDLSFAPGDFLAWLQPIFPHLAILIEPFADVTN